MVSQNSPTIGEYIVITFVTLYSAILTVVLAETPFSFKYLNFKNGTVEPLDSSGHHFEPP